MGTDEGRRSDRISVDLPIQVFGTDVHQRDFLEDSHTIAISRHGATISVRRSLAPDQEIIVRCMETDQEAAARVIGPLGQRPDANPWGIEFPSPAGGNETVARSVLECLRCRTREITYLDGLELEVLETNQVITRKCQRCNDVSIWKKSFAEPISSEATTVKAVPPAPADRMERRREPRRSIRVAACVRSLDFREEIVMTRNVSRGGQCFETRRHHTQGYRIAVPYNPRGGTYSFRPASRTSSTPRQRICT